MRVPPDHVLPAMDGRLVLWLLGDGKPGHENQSLGLAEAIGRRVPVEIHRIDLARRGIAVRLKAAAQSAASLPPPDLILAAGHATHLSLLWFARRHRAKSIVLMRPSLPLPWFDLCIAPQHDFPNGCHRKNVILTRGALNRITPGTEERHGKLILIGGPSKTHGWDGDALLKMLAQATDRGGWELTDSRRTPGDFLDQARRRLPGVSAISHQETPPGWVPEKLRMAKEVWVTEDSVSMIYEALTSGARVGLLPMPRLAGDSRVLRGIDALVAERFLTRFDQWQAAGRIDPPPEPLDEAGRCAVLVVAKFGLADPSRGLH
jgi:mitochondrial fission protein ELM1